MFPCKARLQCSGYFSLWQLPHHLPLDPCSSHACCSLRLPPPPPFLLKAPSFCCRRNNSITCMVAEAQHLHGGRGGIIFIVTARALGVEVCGCSRPPLSSLKRRRWRRRRRQQQQQQQQQQQHAMAAIGCTGVLVAGCWWRRCSSRAPTARYSPTFRSF